MGFPKAESGVKMICLKALLPVDSVVAAGTVSAAYPDLKKDNKLVKKALSISFPAFVGPLKSRLSRFCFVFLPFLCWIAVFTSLL